MVRLAWLILLLGSLGLTACAPKEYMKDWQSQDAPEDRGEIVTLPTYPESGRAFNIRRTYTTTRSSRANRRTPAEGYLETLKVVDDQGTMEFWRDGRRIHTINLGPCYSFAKMDKNHDFEGRGSPAYFTAPPDCRLWDGRDWNQTYRTLVVGWHAPCVYEATRRATFRNDGDHRIVHTYTSIVMTMEKNGSTQSWSNELAYDPETEFFKMFHVGYVGKVEVLGEITE